MPNVEDIRWFKITFGAQIAPKIQGTPITLSMLAALACQETGEVWPILRRIDGMTTAKLLELCVGDTLDSDRGRGVFPLDSDDLISHTPNGRTMFDIARRALVDMAQYELSSSSQAPAQVLPRVRHFPIRYPVPRCEPRLLPAASMGRFRYRSRSMLERTFDSHSDR